jgi:hypothetical protein
LSRAKSCPLHRQDRRSSIPKTRRFLHSGTWSSLNDAWSGLARLRLNTISVRDDRLPEKPPASALSNCAVASGRLVRPARYPIYGTYCIAALSPRLLDADRFGQPYACNDSNTHPVPWRCLHSTLPNGKAPSAPSHGA